ncbi:hypothetical protein [Minisyncoccus archaeiphilus]|uniref:hypothetical protein n=1 Tax=Minisyncoccus archaeiphilus TaxID=3238481 RepID=UPI00399CB198
MKIDKNKAIILRQQGYTYSEILKEVSVAKSTLSLWLKEVGLVESQEQRITEKRISGALKGAKTRHLQRISSTQKIKDEARKEIEYLSKRELWLIGISLYWAEGSKEKDNGTRSGVVFSNSDPRMILLFVKWLRDVLIVSDQDLIYELYIHEVVGVKSAQIYWSQILSIPVATLRTYFKRSKEKIGRKNIGKEYYGLIRVRVRKSTNLNRKISGWAEGICEKTL